MKVQSSAPDLESSSSQNPRHVAIIMDGNNRWAKQRGLRGVEGHKQGAKTVRDTVENCARAGVEVLTVYAFSSENWQRPPKEVEALMGLFLNYLKNEAKKLKSEGVRLKVIGSRERFSPKIQKAIAEAETIAEQGEHTLVIAADYGGRWDMAQAARNLARPHQMGSKDKERNGQEGGVIDAAENLLHDRRIRQATIEQFLGHQRRYAKHQKHLKPRDQQQRGAQNNKQDHA